MTSVELGIVDSLSNCFTPDRRPVWEGAIAASGIAVKIIGDPADDFAEPAEMLQRMDDLGVATVLLPTGDVGPHGRLDDHDFDHVALRWEELDDLAAAHPGRFAGLAIVDPSKGMAGVAALGRRLAQPWVVGLYVHTHSWGLRFDAAELYPYYALAAEHDVPITVQAGTSGGLLPSECGRPIGIDRPAIYFPETRFVLSHTGWPWVAEAVAMALKFPNVYLGTGAYPPRHWDPAVVSFIKGPGRRKVLFGTNFPTVGHTKALEQVAELGLDDDTRDALLGGTARRVYTRLGER